MLVLLYLTVSEFPIVELSVISEEPIGFFFLALILSAFYNVLNESIVYGLLIIRMRLLLIGYIVCMKV